MLQVTGFGLLSVAGQEESRRDELREFWTRTKDVAIGSLSDMQRAVMQRLVKDLPEHCRMASSLPAFDVEIERTDGDRVVHRVQATSQLHARRTAVAREMKALKRVLTVRVAPIDAAATVAPEHWFMRQ
ncbi:MAG: hypothetical protein JSS89_12060 [Bacteroidetes bacterium]|nr:hypothetical protein [Bacteroidota bacterium]